MEVVNEAYKVVRQMLKSVVPPCTVTVDDDFHCEVWAIKDQSKEVNESRVLLGYVIKHADSITVGFNNKLGEKKDAELFSAYLLQKMNPHGHIRVHEMNHQLHTDMQSAIDSLMRYYNSMNWI